MLPIVDYELDTVSECKPFGFGLTLFCYGCNMHCKMCEGYDYERVTNKCNIIGNALDILKSKVNPLHEVVVFLGGEMLIHGDELYKALEWCHSQGLKTKIFTNGMLPDRVKYINEHGLCDSWSVDYKGIQLKDCKEELGIIGTKYFDNLLATVYDIITHKLPLEIRTTFYSANEKEEEGITRYMQNMVQVLRRNYGYEQINYIVQHDFRQFIQQ